MMWAGVAEEGLGCSETVEAGEALHGLGGGGRDEGDEEIGIYLVLGLSGIVRLCGMMSFGPLFVAVARVVLAWLGLNLFLSLMVLTRLNTVRYFEANHIPTKV